MKDIKDLYFVRKEDIEILREEGLILNDSLISECMLSVVDGKMLYNIHFDTSTQRWKAYTFLLFK